MTVQEWIPVSTSPKGKLALAAVLIFGSRPFDDVTVSELAAAADVTTGALYHHFHSKLGLYVFVRRDVERRLLDRMEGAAAGSNSNPLNAALSVGFDFAIRLSFVRLLSEPPPRDENDPLVELLNTLSEPARAPIGQMLASTWRSALTWVADGGSEESAREALLAISVEPAAT